MRILAVDPDTHTMGWALGDGNDIEALGIVSIPRALKGSSAIAAMVEAMLEAFDPIEWSHRFPDLVVVEDQWIFRGNRAAPASILLLGQAAGVALTATAAFLGHTGDPRGVKGSLELLSVKDWKGERPKELVQARAYQHYGWGSRAAAGYCIPQKAEVQALIRPLSGWKHVGDAVGMVLWAASHRPVRGPDRVDRD